MPEHEIKWIEWAREIQALAQTGLAFSLSEYDSQRYSRLMEIAAEIISANSELDKNELVDVFMKQPGYATPKIDVRSAVINDGKILLVQEKADNRWAMPGGWADVGNYPSEVAERETREESGFEVEAKKVIGVFDANRSGRPLELFHAFKIIFLCELKGGSASISNETLAVDFFSFDNLPPLSENRTNLRHINEILLHMKDQNRPSFFD